MFFAYLVGMFLGCLVAGLLPLKMLLSPSFSILLGQFGMGLLVGCSMLVILPEGVKLLASAGSDALNGLGISLLIGFLSMLIVEESIGHDHDHDHTQSVTPRPASVLKAHVADVELDQLNVQIDSNDVAAPTFVEGPHLTSMLGVLIHNCIDGIVLAAVTTISDAQQTAVVSGHSQPESETQHPTTDPFVIFVAIALHKVPSAFGIVSVWCRRRHRRDQS